MTRLAELSTTAYAALLATKEVVVLLPVGSVEPHGPHLPLCTDTLISQGAAALAAQQLTTGERVAVIAPAVPYGVTDFAAGFAGAISVPAEVLTPFLNRIAAAFLADGAAAVRAALYGLPSGRASIACPLSRRWGRTLSAEYKSGACHAGQYETSLVLAVEPGLVDERAAQGLPASTLSLSEGIAAGKTTFKALGMDQAYTGSPAEATREEGAEMLERLATMIVREVVEGLESLG